MVSALNHALRDSLQEDPRVLVFGEDVGEMGGVFRVTAGLQAEFGNNRVFDTPVAEAGIAGAAVGLALAGWKSVVEMQFDGFSYPALDQVISHWAKYRMRTRGRVGLPIVMRIPSFGGIRGKEHHGESPETYYVHTAGLKVVAPSTPLDAYRLLRLAIHYGSMVARSLEAAEALATEGVDVRLVDLRSLSPLDLDAIGQTARDTGRVVVVHEAPKTLGLGAEVAARVMEEAFDYLEAPVARVTGWDVPYPPAALEERYLPSAERIAEAVRKTVGY